MSKTKFGVALLGFGTVGRGVFELLNRQNKGIQNRYDVEFEVRRILVRDAKKPRGRVDRKLITTDFRDIIDDPTIDVVIEVMGGEKPAREYLLEALRTGKHVITANKALMGAWGDKLVARARQEEKFFGYSAAVTGFHQLIPSILKSIRITELAGIFNGTSNYILTKLGEKSFAEALSEAVKEGYAEENHVQDTGGFDTRNKLVMAICLAFGIFPECDKISVEGMTAITKEDVQYAAELGYIPKLLGISRLTGDNHFVAFVAPALVPQNDVLARADGVNNAILVRDEFRGIQGMIAAGAGKDATAMAIFSDLVSMARREAIAWPYRSAKAKGFKFTKNLPPAPYYVRVDAKNQPGALANIGKHLARSGINIKDVWQRSRGDEASVSIVFVLGVTNPKNIDKVLNELLENRVISGKPVKLRIEHSPAFDQHAAPAKFADEPISRSNSKLVTA